MTTHDLIEILRCEARELACLVKEWREYLHQNPEPSFKEFKTMEFVAEKLSAYKIPHQKGFCGTGVVGHIKALVSNGTIGLRADLDALPILERNDVHYKSQNEGWMHACGHDVHTAILLGAAVILQKHRAKLKNDVKLIFQPGEEMHPGGASLMINDGVLENPRVEAMFALHVYPELESGQVGIKSGLYMASSDEILIEISGKAGHAALPERCVNPLFMGSELILALSEFIQKESPKNVPTLINFGRFEALGSTNVIPEHATIKGTFRTMDSHWRETAFEQMEKIAFDLGLKYSGSIELKRSKGYPNLENDPVLTEVLWKIFQTALGEENVKELNFRMTAEDFAFYASVIPSCFFRLGVGNKKEGIVHAVHHPNFDIDSSSLETGVFSMVLIPFLYERD
ncbi:MAG: amidohydrolase [Bacteroidetes bacterium]|nr:amidohydrolase [Bacteroidota bacterium]